MLKKVLIYISAVLLLIILLTLYVVYDARVYTKKIVIPFMKLKMWRIYYKEPRHINVFEASLPERWKTWLIKIQDPNFYNHHGIDLFTPGAGLTTITQSIVKKLYFKNFKPGYRKLKQSIIAYLVVDEMFTKSEQLTLFLSSCYMGQGWRDGIYGFENAAQEYYKKPLLKLSDDEYLSLVAMLISPNKFNIKTHPNKNLERVQKIKRVINGKYIPKGLNDVYYN